MTVGGNLAFPDVDSLHFDESPCKGLEKENNVAAPWVVGDRVLGVCPSDQPSVYGISYRPAGKFGRRKQSVL